LLAAALVGVVLLVAEGRPGAAEPGPRVELVDGTLSLQNSLEGQAVFSAEDIAPGESAGGSVTVSNAGTLPGSLTLAESGRTDMPGPGGGALSERLQLVVQDVTSGTTVYSGRLDALGSVALGTLGPGAGRVYSFTASLPADAADDSVAGASVNVSYRWTAADAPSGEPPVAPPPSDSTTDLRHPLRLRVRVPRGQRVAARGRLYAYVRCNQSCWAEGRAQLRAHGRRVRTRRDRSGRLSAGLEARLVLRLPAAARRKLARALGKGRRARVTVMVKGRSAAGARRTVAKKAMTGVERGRGSGS
jgi:hypothetical protein